MVGLRWWNQVDDDGRSHWKFESRKVRLPLVGSGLSTPLINSYACDGELHSLDASSHRSVTTCLFHGGTE